MAPRVLSPSSTPTSDAPHVEGLASALSSKVYAATSTAMASNSLPLDPNDHPRPSLLAMLSDPILDGTTGYPQQQQQQQGHHRHQHRQEQAQHHQQLHQHQMLQPSPMAPPLFSAHPSLPTSPQPPLQPWHDSSLNLLSQALTPSPVLDLVSHSATAPTEVPAVGLGQSGDSNNHTVQESVPSTSLGSVDFGKTKRWSTYLSKQNLLKVFASRPTSPDTTSTSATSPLFTPFGRQSTTLRAPTSPRQILSASQVLQPTTTAGQNHSNINRDNSVSNANGIGIANLTSRRGSVSSPCLLGLSAHDQETTAISTLPRPLSSTSSSFSAAAAAMSSTPASTPSPMPTESSAAATSSPKGLRKRQLSATLLSARRSARNILKLGLNSGSINTTSPPMDNESSRADLGSHHRPSMAMLQKQKKSPFITTTAAAAATTNATTATMTTTSGSAIPNSTLSSSTANLSKSETKKLQKAELRRRNQGKAAELPFEILSLIFRCLMDRKTILNCCLVSTRWYGPGQQELARICQDLPYNGQGLVQAIRTRFASDTFPAASVASFDKLVWNLSEVYYHSNKETTTKVFAPSYPPDLLYHLFWTFLFIDQEFRHPRSRPKVSCAYFVRLLQSEGGGYPREYFDKQVLKSIYKDIRSAPLLPAPHLIRALQELEHPAGVATVAATTGPAPGQADEGAPLAQVPTNLSTEAGVGANTFVHAHNGHTHNANHHSPVPSPEHRRLLRSALRLDESLMGIRRWWRNTREDHDRNQVGWVSRAEIASVPVVVPASVVAAQAAQANLAATAVAAAQGDMDQPISTLSGSNLLQPLATESSQPLHPHTSTALTSTLSQRFPTRPLSPSGFGTGGPVGASVASKAYSSNSNNSSNNNMSTLSIFLNGFTTVGNGWHARGDGLDCVVRFPKPKGPSTLGKDHQILQAATVVAMMHQNEESEEEEEEEEAAAAAAAEVALNLHSHQPTIPLQNSEAVSTVLTAIA